MTNKTLVENYCLALDETDSKSVYNPAVYSIGTIDRFMAARKMCFKSDTYKRNVGYA